jgi:hypothetical protein
MVKWISCAWLCSFASLSELKSLPGVALQDWVGPSWYEECFLPWISQRSGVSFHEPRPFSIPIKTHSSSNCLDFQSCSSIRRLLRHRFVATIWTTRKAWILGGN